MFYLMKCFTKTGILAGMGAETTLPAKEEGMYVNVGNIENATINVENAEIHIIRLLSIICKVNMD